MLLASLLVLAQSEKLEPVVFTGNMVGPVMIGEEMVQWWDVEVALPDGRPDLNAPNNSWSEARVTWKLAVDSRNYPADANGTVKVHQKAEAFIGSPIFWQSAEPSPKLSEQFTKIFPEQNRLHSQWTSKSTSGPDIQTVTKSFRYVKYMGMIEKTQYETRTLGKETVRRTRKEAPMPSYRGVILHGNQQYNPYTTQVTDPKN